MTTNPNKEREMLEKQFQELLDKAKKKYPDIEGSINTFNDITVDTINYQEYLNLTARTPSETSSNQTIIHT